MKIYDKQGQAIEVSEDQVPEALASGQYGIPADQLVPIKTDDGQIGTVPGSQLQTALGNGASIISHEEHAQAVQQARFGGVGSQAIAGVAGAARGASLGTSDLAARALGGQETADYLRNLQEANPITSGAGEVAGVLAPALLTGGASAAEEAPGLLSSVGRAIGAPGRLVEGAGGLGEALASGLLPEEATTMAGRLGSAVAKGAARAGVEGAVYGAGDQISEQALSQNPDLDGEKFLSAIGHGALLGAATGGLLSGTGAAGREVLGALSPHLASLAEDAGVKALKLDGKLAREADEVQGGAKAIARDLIDTGVMQAGQSIGELAPKISAAKDVAGARVGDVLEHADAAGFQGPSVKTILSDLDSKARAGLDLLPSLNRPAIERVEALQDDIRKIAGLPTRADALREGLGELPPVPDEARLGFKQAQEIRRRIDVEAKWASSPIAGVPELAKAMRSARSSIEDEIERAGDTASKKLGGSFAEDYADAKLKFQRLAIAEKAAERASKASATGIPGATDTLGAVLGLTSGHPALAVGSLASGYVRKLARERGATTAAVWLDKLGALGGVQQATGSVDRQIARGVARATGDASVAKVRSREPIRGFDAMRKSVEEAVSDNAAHTETIRAAAAPIAQHSPAVANAFERAAVRATIYLANALPKPAQTSALTPKLDRDEPSDAAKATYTRIFNAVHDPVSLLGRVEDGSITADEVAAVKATAPETYASMCEQVKDSLLSVSNAKRLPYARRIALSTFLGQPVDATLTPAFVAAMQAGSPGAPPPQPGRPPKSSGGHSKASSLPLAKSSRLTGQGPPEV